MDYTLIPRFCFIKKVHGIKEFLQAKPVVVYPITQTNNSKEFLGRKPVVLEDGHICHRTKDYEG